MIYFVQAGADHGPIKIGYVENATMMAQRLRILQTGNHEPLYVAASLPGSWDRERELHARFAEGRLRGEWFRHDTPGLQDLIAEAIEAEAALATDRRIRYCSWCRTQLVRPPRTRLCSDECERDKKLVAARAWKAANRVA